MTYSLLWYEEEESWILTLQDVAESDEVVVYHITVDETTGKILSDMYDSINVGKMFTEAYKELL